MGNPPTKQVNWLLVDLAEKLGYSMAARELARFVALVPLGPSTFADAVLTAEGLDPNQESNLRDGVRSFVIKRFAQWETEGYA